MGLPAIDCGRVRTKINEAIHYLSIVRCRWCVWVVNYITKIL